jgi:hypothetical protein
VDGAGGGDAGAASEREDWRRDSGVGGGGRERGYVSARDSYLARVLQESPSIIVSLPAY